MNTTIHRPTQEETAAALKEFFGQQKSMRKERVEAVKLAIPALGRLVEVCRCRSGQPYKVRALLYSLWNGQPADLSEVLNLDWAIRKDVAAVILAFGYEDAEVKFFYNAVTSAFKSAGLFEWFMEEYKGDVKV